MRTWKLKVKDVVRKFQNDGNNRLENDANLISETVEDNWKHLKINLLKDTELSCGLSKKKGKWRSRHDGRIVQLMKQ